MQRTSYVVLQVQPLNFVDLHLSRGNNGNGLAMYKKVCFYYGNGLAQSYKKLNRIF